MARTVQQIKAELEKVTAENKKSYEAVYGQASVVGGVYKEGGIEQRYNIAVNAGDTATVNKLKPLYEAALVKYKETQEKKNALAKELEEAQKQVTTEKTTAAKSKAAKSVYDKALADLQLMENRLSGPKGTENYVTAYQAAQQAYNNAVAAGVTPKALPEKLTPVPDFIPKQEQVKQDTGKQVVEDYIAFKNTLADPNNKKQLVDLQKDLIKNWGYSGKADGVYTLSLQNALDNIANNRSLLPDALKGSDFRTFIATQNKGLLGGGAGGSGSGQYTPTTNIYSKNEAANTIQNTVKSLLDRDATPEEITKYTTLLQKAQSDPKNAVRTTKNKFGVLETTGGLNAQQFVEDLIRGGSEYKGIVTKAATKKASAEESNLAYAKNLLQQTAIANGLDLTKNFGSSADEWAKRIADGEDPTMFKKAIRDVAKTGMPDNVAKLLDQGVDLETIYAPYKNLMQSVLEIPANQVNLNDPTLRSAIGAEKPMTIYEFQNSLRKDPRWQFTANAHDTVSTAVQNVLKDFGFMG